MAQINVNNLTFYYDGSFDNIFEEVSFSIDTDWKLGFIGRNGKGKTTFLNLLMGKYEYRGSISTNMVFDYFPYPVKSEYLTRSATEFVEEWKEGTEQWRIICELGQLGLDAEVLYRPFGTLSFGERVKVMLAVLFSGENDFLLIDEPTNHLDRESREIVKEYLAGKKGFILVSHDRDFLDACVDHILALNRQTIEVQAGNFSSWWENKSRKDAFAKMENEKHKREISKLKTASERANRWAEKNESMKIGHDPVKDHDWGNGARPYIGAKTKKMQSRVTQMKNRIDREIEEKEGLLQDIECPAELKMMPMEHFKKRLITANGYGIKYKEGDKFLFKNLSFEVNQGDRILVKGTNGCGKSSLIKAVLKRAGWKGENEEEKTEVIETGSLQTVSGLVISYISQDTSFLYGKIKDFCRKRQLDESLFCAILRQLDLERVQFGKNMEDFSEGQKKKVLIAASLLTPAHLYVWDEPLNYIDVFSRMQIEKLLLDCRPTMLVVEHDVRFGERIGTGIIEWQ